jgi:hypothetical protein
VQIADRWVSNTCWYNSTTGESAESFDSFITSEDPPSYEWFAADTEVIVVPGRLVRINPVISTPDINLDTHPFAIVFDPAGGTFETPQWFEETQRTVPSANVGTILFDYTKNRWIWYSDSTEKILPVTFSNLPYSADTGLVPPTGIGSARSWVIAAPFNESSVVSVLSPTCTFELELKRSSQDAICQKTSYPEWVPERGDQQRAFITAPGYGYMDLGHIQSINEVYTPQVQQIPIVVYGFKNSFCMDTGVKKEIELQYIRTQPAMPLDESGDSRVWSNAKWIRTLKEIMNRWQMRTNGNKLYILRPANEIEDDPMRTYTDEIVGLNCYISQVPIAYGNMPHALQGRISFKVGTLYPKQRELALRQIRYIDPKDPNRSAVVYSSGRWLTLPSANAMWPPTDSQSRIYGDWSWTTTDNRQDTGAPGRLVDLNTVSGTYEYVFSANAIYDGVMQYRVVTDVVSEKKFTISPMSSVVTIFVAAVGGGGGGGAGRVATYDPGGLFSNKTYRISGGGGGGAGQYRDNTYIFADPPESIEILYSVGKGGNGGNGSNNNYSPGSDGDPTTIKVSDYDEINASPGKGGEGGDKDWEEGDGNIAHGGKGGDSQGTYSGAGGSGGQRNHEAESGNYPSLSDIRTAGPGQAYPNKYESFGNNYQRPKPPIGRYMALYPLKGIDVGGGGGAAIWAGPSNRTIYPDQNGNDRTISSPGKGGDGAYLNSPPVEGRLGGGGGGGGGGAYIGTEKDGGAEYSIYQFYPGAKGGDGYVFISVAGGTIS